MNILDIKYWNIFLPKKIWRILNLILNSIVYINYLFLKTIIYQSKKNLNYNEPFKKKWKWKKTKISCYMRDVEEWWKSEKTVTFWPFIFWHPSTIKTI